MSNHENDNSIKITHYINPHMFWFKYEVDCFNEDLFTWESELQNHYFKLLKSPPTEYQPQLGEVVAVFIFSFNRWIRASVDSIDVQDDLKKYHVWAIDYGVPFQVEDRWIRPIPEDFLKCPKEAIHFASLMNIVPAQKTFNLEKLETELIPCENWSTTAITTIGKLIKEANDIRFISIKKSTEGQLFGNLVFTSALKKAMKADQILQEIGHAKTVNATEFFDILNMIKSNRLPRFLSEVNTRGTGEQKCNANSKVKEAFPEQIAPDVSDNEIDVARKFTDWEKRNEMYRMHSDISIDDFSFNDSVSVRHLQERAEKIVRKTKDETVEDEEDPPLIMKAGVLRQTCLRKYQHGIPLPPPAKFEKDGSVMVAGSFAEDLNASNLQLDNGSLNYINSVASPKTKNKADNTSDKDTGISNAMRLLIDRRANIRKNLVVNSRNEFESETHEEKKMSAEEVSDFKETKFLRDRKLASLAKSVVVAEKAKTLSAPLDETDSNRSEIKSLELSDRYKNKIQEKNIIPAGFDLRNLSQNVKNVRRSSELELNDYEKSSKPFKNGVPQQEFERLSLSRNPTYSIEKIPQRDKRDQFQDKPNTRASGHKDSGKECLNNLDEICLQSHLAKHLVFVHGKHIAKPIDKLKSANFCNEVHQELELMRLTQIYRIQSYTWPHLMRGNSSVIVSSSRTGRTLSYLPAICSLIKVESDEGTIPDTVGPIGIIVAPSSLEVERISKLCRRFLHGSPTKIAIVESFGVRNMQKATRYLLNGCEVLVATPPSLNRLLKNKLKLFDTKRIKHLIFDDIDFMREEMKRELHEILRFSCGSKSTTSIQLVVIAKYWSPILSGFLKMAHNTLLCIGAYIEAAVYARTLFKLKIIKKTSKTQELIDFTKAHPYLTERLIIVCNKDEELREVVEVLKSNSYFHIACTMNSTTDEIELSKVWHQRTKGEMSILVCTDDILPELKVSDAQNIVHYSLPQSWTRFSFRFSTLFGYFDDFIKSAVSQRTPPACLILLDENNNAQLPKLINFLRIHQVEGIANEIHTVCNKIKIQREEERIAENRQFCPYMMEFGKCFDMEDCMFRHELTKFDTPPDNLNLNGNIYFKVLSVISPTHYTVRILEHQSDSQKPWRKVAGSQEYLKFNLKFAQYFSNTDSHQLHWPVAVNDLCAISEGVTFHRGKILHVSKCNSPNLSTDSICRVKLVDTGRVLSCKASRIFFLPEEFKQLPHQAVDLRLSGIIPYDHEHDWSSSARETVEYWFNKYATDKVKAIAKITMVMMHTIWVENVKLIENLESIQTYVTVVNIKSSLLEKQFGTLNHNMEEVLKEKAIACGIFKNASVDIEKDYIEENNASYHKSDKLEPSRESVYSTVSSKEFNNKSEQNFEMNSNKLTKESWEEMFEERFLRVFIGAFYSPNNFYIQDLRHLKSIEELYKAIDSHVEQNPSVVTEPIIGLNCLAKYDGKYNRAKITKVFCDGESHDLRVSLFFCDIGMSCPIQLSEVLSSNKQLVEMLPFQAIRCKLAGIVPKTYGVWTNDACDCIYDDILHPAHNLYARPVRVEKPGNATILKYWTYEVILLDCTTDKDVNINEYIVEIGLGCYNSETRHLLSFTTKTKAEDFSDNASDSDWDDCNYTSPAKMNFDLNFSLDLDVDADIQFTEEDIIQLLNLPSSAKILPPAVPQLEANTETKDLHLIHNENEKIPMQHKSVTTNENCGFRQYKRKQDKSISPLKKLFHTPHVTWQQSESLITLQIMAPDLEDYYLKISQTSLIFIAMIQNELRIIVLSFLGCVDPSLASHDVRGLKAIISLPKALKGFFWPRLTNHGDKSIWLKYDYDSIITEQESLFTTAGRFKPSTSLGDMSSDSNDVEDDEHDMYENVDLFDPFD